MAWQEGGSLLDVGFLIALGIWYLSLAPSSRPATMLLHAAPACLVPITSSVVWNR